MGGGSGPAASRWIAGGGVEAVQQPADPGGGMERAADPNAGVEEAASAVAVLSRRQQDGRRRHPGRGAGGGNAGDVHRPSEKTATTLLQVRSPRFSFSFLTRGSCGGVGEKPRRRWRGVRPTGSTGRGRGRRPPAQGGVGAAPMPRRSRDFPAAMADLQPHALFFSAPACPAGHLASFVVELLVLRQPINNLLSDSYSLPHLGILQFNNYASGGFVQIASCIFGGIVCKIPLAAWLRLKQVVMGVL
ncbi:uncharacterized protein LOC120672992 isoform X2 [Panicum virgatum]|uniref:uncharacterized protein LOC120672992 isoform X2 n=2 Tax=Panicum virgatum TaxID=38727 RepID=UPI0019D64AB2|nr:uncharacterized protein LOC120672992 isoform X2 [Panicum virgatum]